MGKVGIKGYLHSVETFGAVDGPGIRYVVFLQGCPLRCLYCHNPDSWKPDGGKVTTADEIIEDIEKYINFIKDGGVTVSGGEPLVQADFTEEIINGCKKLGLHTAIDTAGSIPIEKTASAINAADMLLLDIKTADFPHYKELTGRDEKTFLDTINYCEKINKRIWARHVLVPGITLDERRLNQLADFIAGYSCVELTELLPFHKMGEYKWEELGYEYKLKNTRAPVSDEMKKAEEIFLKKGLNAVAK